MGEFYIGQIFVGEYSPVAAQWCNNRGDCYITEAETIDGLRQFQIVEISTPTEEELREKEVEDIKAQLKELDLKSIRAIRAGDTEYIQKYEESIYAV